MDLIGKVVNHGKFGEGTIIGFDEKGHIIISFDSISEEKTFKYPDSFKKFLVFKDFDCQRKVDTTLSEKTKKEEQTKNQAKILEQRRRRIRSEKEQQLEFDSILSPVREAFDNLIKMGYKDLGDEFPSRYDSSLDQARYILRYLYAYSFEYYHVFSDIIKLGLWTDHIEITSLGCGAMLDAWSLQEATRLLIGEKASINYIGVDKAVWGENYAPKTKRSVNKTFINKKAGEYLLNQSDMKFDILFFPKSIGDIFHNDRMDFSRIIEALQKKELKRTFFLAFSLIMNESENEKDKKVIKELVKALEHKGYKYSYTENELNTDYVGTSKPKYGFLDDDIFYQSKELTGSLTMTKRKYENYMIYKFEKDDTE